MINEMNPGSFTFGPVFWAVAVAIIAFAVVGVMVLFLWQAAQEPAPKPTKQAPHPAPQQDPRPALGVTRPAAQKPIGRPA